MSRYFFFFQAEDGIRDGTVTGVQTCALPIWSCPFNTVDGLEWTRPPRPQQERFLAVLRNAGVTARSEERRVGKECRCRWAAEHEKKKGKVGRGADAGEDTSTCRGVIAAEARS